MGFVHPQYVQVRFEGRRYQVPSESRSPRLVADLFHRMGSKGRLGDQFATSGDW